MLSSAIENSENSSALPEFVKDKHIIILVEDATRDVPNEDIFKIMAPKLKAARVLEIVICTGTHHPDAPGNKELLDSMLKILNNHGLKNVKSLIHNSKEGPFDDYGKSTFGNNFLVNKAIKKADAFVVLSDMKNHYFAGYSNPLKNFIPGVCGYSTVEKNHAMALKEKATFGKHPWHPDSNRNDNPLATEMLEGYQKILKDRPVWALVCISKQKKIIWCCAGDPKSATQAGIRKVDEMMSRSIKPADVLIVSSGGFPNDESIYTAQRALELNQHAVKPGGKIIFLAECRNGIGPPSAIENFYNLLTNDLHQVFRIIEKDYIMYSHKAYKFARMISKLDFLGIKSNLAPDIVKSIHLKPVEDPQELIDTWLKENPQLTFNIIDDGNKIAVYPENL
jgi:nickel-dependent lactate racemase